jgi:outer membrane protein assembly factor BamB
MTGKTVWAKNLGVPVNHYGYSSSLIVYNNKVIVQYDQKNLAQVIALSTTSGEAVWTAKRNVKISWSSPVIVNTGNRMELLTTADPFIISYNPDTGEELWRITGVSGEVGPSMAYADGVVFAVNDYSRLVAVKISDKPGVLWEDQEYLSDVPSPVANKDYLFVATSYGMVVCYNTKTGEKFWEHEIDNTIYASPLIADGKVYLVDKQGITHIFKVDRTFTSLGTPGIGEKIVCTPAFAGERIYLRGYDHLFCIGH